MAAITLFDDKGMGATWLVRTGAAQADTGQTDWLKVPGWARYVQFILNVTAVAGNTPILTTTLKFLTPRVFDDGSSADLAFTTPPTAAGTHVIDVGPGVTGIADDVVQAATGDSLSSVNKILPRIIGYGLALDRTSADETYTYTLTASWRP